MSSHNRTRRWTQEVGQKICLAGDTITILLKEVAHGRATVVISESGRELERVLGFEEHNLANGWTLAVLSVCAITGAAVLGVSFPPECAAQ